MSAARSDGTSGIGRTSTATTLYSGHDVLFAVRLVIEPELSCWRRRPVTRIVAELLAMFTPLEQDLETELALAATRRS